jgi:hypothetical protein
MKNFTSQDKHTGIFLLTILGAFLARSAKNRAFRSNSSDLPMQILWDFRYNPIARSAA